MFKEEENEVNQNMLALRQRELKYKTRLLTKALSAKTLAFNDPESVRLKRKRNLGDASGHRSRERPAPACKASSGAGLQLGYDSFWRIQMAMNKKI